MDYLSLTHRTVAWLKKAHDEGSLDLRPPFQRNPVWLNPQKAYLIDTILRGYPVPELYMQDVVTDSGAERHIVVDGQQRIRACLEYVEGSFGLSEKDTPEYGDLTFDDLPSEAKQRIFQYKLVVRVLPTIPEEELKAIFRRLNRNVVALNAQELRHATYWGPFISSMETLGEDTYWASTGLFSPNDVRRMLDVEFISELAVGFLNGPQNKKLTLEGWYETYEASFAERDAASLRNVFQSVTGELKQVLPDIQNHRWSKHSDFYSLFLYLAQHSDELPLASDKRATLRMRLIEFGNDVDQLIADPDAKVPHYAKRYLAAVERAATDLANRRNRIESIGEVLDDLFAAGGLPVATKTPPKPGVRRAAVPEE
jgi:hypothetical protein